MASFIKNCFRFDADTESERLLAEFRQNGNPLSAFLADHFEKATGRMVSTLQLYAEYRNYCESNLLPSCPMKQFRPQLAQMGYQFAKKRIDGQENPVSCVLDLRRKNMNQDRAQTYSKPLDLSVAIEQSTGTESSELF